MDSNNRHKIISTAVWILRIAVGATFMVSGASKMIDPYGFIYKIQQYLAVWGWDVSDSLILAASVGLSGIEFLCGLALSTGSYKRTVVWLMAMIMAGMLPLSIYIAIADPVDDCGCFGDFLVISNSMTCIKNLLIAAALAYLLIYNRRVHGIYWPYLQWIQMTLGFIYIAVVGVIGYHSQPLIDFRPYKVGTELIPASSDSDGRGLRFIYEKDGERKEFSGNELPDSTWTYIDRIEPVHEDESSIVLYDIMDDSDVTDDIAADLSDGDALVLLIPDVKKAGVANTYIINELQRYINLRGGLLIALIGSDRTAAMDWMDLAMAEYPAYLAEATAIKEIARGNIAVVYTHDGIITWKRTLWSVGTELFEPHDGSDWLMAEFSDSGSKWFWWLTSILFGALLILWIISRSAIGLRHRFSQKNKKKNVNLQPVEDVDVNSPEDSEK